MFFRHIKNDHDTHFNLDLMLKMSLMQPTDVRDEGWQETNGNNLNRDVPQLHTEEKNKTCEKEFFSSRRVPPTTGFNYPLVSELDSTPYTSVLPLGGQVAFQTQPNISLLQPSVRTVQPSSLPLSTATVPDFSCLDPISFVKQEPDHRHGTGIVGTLNNSFENQNNHIIPEDLQSLISYQNPSRGIKFTLSQRMNTQMVVDDYVLRKKKGPYLTKGGRVINWRCIRDICQYTALTIEGQIQDMARQHNHPSQPEQYFKKQVRAKIRENMKLVKVEQKDPVTEAVMEVIGDTFNDMSDKIGSVDAHKQAARRFSRKQQECSNSTPFSKVIDTQTTSMMFTPASAEDIFVPASVFQNCEVSPDLHPDFLISAAVSGQ